MIINHSDNEIFLVHSNRLVEVLFYSFHVPDDNGLILWCWSKEWTIRILSNSSYPFLVLGQCHHQKPAVWVPDSDTVVARTWDDKVSIRLEILHARNFMLVTLQSFKHFKVVSLLALPDFDGHIFWAGNHAFTIRMKVQVVDHASMLSQGLLALPCFIIPDLYWGILAAAGNLRVVWMEVHSSHTRSMPFQLKFLWFSGYCVSTILFLSFAIILHFTWQSASIFFNWLFYVLHIYLMLVVHFFQLFALSLKIHHLFFQSCDARPFSFEDVFE